MLVSQDAIGCDCLVVCTSSGFMDLYNISHGFKQFTSVMAYADMPVNKAIPYVNFGPLDKGIVSISNDG